MPLYQSEKLNFKFYFFMHKKACVKGNYLVLQISRLKAFRSTGIKGQSHMWESFCIIPTTHAVPTS